jgi:hypothetical protein
MRRVLVIVALLALTAPVAEATIWRVVKSGSATGDFAVKAVTADIRRPTGIAIRLKGAVSNGSGVVSCSKGYGIASWHRSYTRAGLFVLPMTGGAATCTVIASVGGTGRVTVQILRR